jgi:DNA-binding NarL/FixJ family response regulator
MTGALATTWKESLLGLPLARRETEVLIALAAGKTSKQIAGELRVSLSTVKNHRASVLAKLGAESAAHAVAIAIARELIRAPRGSGA